MPDQEGSSCTCLVFGGPPCPIVEEPRNVRPRRRFLVGIQRTGSLFLCEHSDAHLMGVLKERAVGGNARKKNERMRSEPGIKMRLDQRPPPFFDLRFHGNNLRRSKNNAQ